MAHLSDLENLERILRQEAEPMPTVGESGYLRSKLLSIADELMFVSEYGATGEYENLLDLRGRT